MIRALEACAYDDVTHGDSCASLIKAKWRALAILHDCPEVVPATVQAFDLLSTLPDVDELECRQAGAEEWLAFAIKALIEAGGTNEHRATCLARFAATGLEHAERILKRQEGTLEGHSVGSVEGHAVGRIEGQAQGRHEGYQERTDEVDAERETNRQKAGKALIEKGEKKREKILACYRKLLKANGNYRGIQAEVAKTVGVTPQRVSQVLK